MPSFFQNITTLPALEKERRKLAKKHHPDVGGSLVVMQEINAEYERAKKRIAAPPADRVYTYPCPKPEPHKPWTWPDDAFAQWFYNATEGRAKAEAQRQQYRDQVDRQRQKVREEIEWVRNELRKMQMRGELSRCYISLDFTQTNLEVSGANTYHSRARLKELGFRWDNERKVWYFHKKPLFTDEEESEEDDDDYGK